VDDTTATATYFHNLKKTMKKNSHYS